MILSYFNVAAIVMVCGFGYANAIVNYTIENETWQSVTYDHCDVLFNKPICRNYVVGSGENITFSSKSLRDKTIFEIKNIRMGKALCVQTPQITVIDKDVKIIVNQLGLSNCQVDLGPLMSPEEAISKFEIASE